MATPAIDVKTLDKEALLLGIPQQQVPEEQYFELWSSNIKPFVFFQKVKTQWRFKPMGGVSGLDYTSVIAVIKLHKKKKKMLDDIQAIEEGFLSKMNNGE